jgi:hypothetical protein
MKRLALAALALIALSGTVSPRAVQAGQTSATAVGTNAGLVAAIVNPVLALVPAPEGWDERRVCFGSTDLDKAWCLYFAWPF